MNTATASPTDGPNHAHVDHEKDHEMDQAAAARLKMGWGQRAIVVLLLTVVLVPPLAGFYSYFSGVPLHLLAAKKLETEEEAEAEAPSISLVSGKPHTLEVTEEVAAGLGIRKAEKDSVAVAQRPTTMRPLVLPGSTDFNPSRLARIRARFAPARVVQLAQVQDRDPKTGQTEYRDLRPGDVVARGDLLGIFYSVDVGSKKNDLLQALVQLELDQKILDKVEANRFSVPEVYFLTQVRAVQGDRTEVNRALNNLKLWDIPQDEIDALHAEARKIGADKNAWFNTPEGRWVMGFKQSACDLRLISSVKDDSVIPKTGKDLIIVAAVENALHFRMFDSDGKMVVDTDEKMLPGQARRIEDLRKQLAGLWPLRELAGTEKDRVIATVTSIVGHNPKPVGGPPDPFAEHEIPWGRVTLRSPIDGVVIEYNIHKDEMVIDNTVNLFQIADVNQLLVKANCPEDQLPALEALGFNERKWTVRTVGADAVAGLTGTIAEISYIIDPNQHTAVVKGYVGNPGRRIRAGQYVAATVNIPPPADVVEIPVDALVDDGRQSLVFVQPDAAKRQYTMRRVHVTHRFDRTVFVQDTPIPKAEQLTALEADEGLLPQEPLRPGERVLVAGSVELKRVAIDLESRRQEQPAEQLAKAKMRSALTIESRSEPKPKPGKG